MSLMVYQLVAKHISCLSATVLPEICTKIKLLSESWSLSFLSGHLSPEFTTFYVPRGQVLCGLWGRSHLWKKNPPWFITAQNVVSLQCPGWRLQEWIGSVSQDPQTHTALMTQQMLWRRISPAYMALQYTSTLHFLTRPHYLGVLFVLWDRQRRDREGGFEERGLCFIHSPFSEKSERQKQ